jgi:lysophospholipase L1-like esterase
MGLHGWQKGRIPDGQFEPLTRKLVDTIRAKAPNATLIWASSTPVTAKDKPGELSAEINPIIVEHNRMAAKVMAEAKVPVNDLYSVVSGRLDLARGDQFHWKPEGTALLKDAVVATLQRELKARASR